MAKKSKKKNTKELRPQYDLPGGFWPQILAIAMIALAIFCVFTWFGQGGSALEAIHNGVFWLIGYADYFMPLLLVYLAVKIFTAEGNRLSWVVWVAAVLMVCWVAGIFGLSSVGLEGMKTGGMLGEILNNVATQILDKNVAIFIYIILIFITAIFILQISPVTAFKFIVNLFRKKPKEELSEDEDADTGIKINSGVQTMEPDELRPARAVAKSPVEKAPKAEDKALTTVSDANWKMPSIDLFEKNQSPANAGNVQQNSLIIQRTLAEFGIEVEMKQANIGPSITQYTMTAPAGVNLSKISARDKELALNLAAKTVRIEAPIPGTQLVGVEVPNIKSATVGLRMLLESPEWKKENSPLKFVIGKDMSGNAVIGDLADMRHLLIAGTTGSGKSVMMNTLLMSLLFTHSPSDLRLIIVDVKKVEMEAYNNIPHLLTPIINDDAKAVSALKWAVGEMQRRFTTLQNAHVKKIEDFNGKIMKDGFIEVHEDGEVKKVEGKMPYIIIVIDEMAQIMMQAGKELEPSIVQLAQLGRAAGMHLVLATQKPVVKVITGLIKSNIPSRICFRVLTNMDSRIMLDESGAEKLVGRGDMLLSTEKTGGMVRLQGVWTSDKDIYNMTDYLRLQGVPDYNNEVIAQAVAKIGPSGGGAFGDLGRRFDPNDPVVRQAVEISLSKGKFSTAMLQTYLGKGHGFVSGLAIWLEENNIIGEANGNKPRELLISSMDEFDDIINNSNA